MSEKKELDMAEIQRRTEHIYARHRLEDVERELGQLTMQKLFWEERLKLTEKSDD